MIKGLSTDEPSRGPVWQLDGGKGSMVIEDVDLMPMCKDVHFNLSNRFP